ncbi:protein RNA-directed DNA methylation 3-like [Arachis ipaensis]|uniref:protein RNA-directed DNA methylation 3-like n=1 Tax=Arachis ipaensis TaxID=130454 RepID=UPI0007AFC4BC|nr:protein RNA-directed DNA methylation 3-like [Arachis ipaensis]XP_025670312.1 protein RNA-directed DNA methylation 3-like [Arachis hypogaea]
MELREVVGVGWCWRWCSGDIGWCGGDPWWRQRGFGVAGLRLGYREGKGGSRVVGQRVVVMVGGGAGGGCWWFAIGGSGGRKEEREKEGRRKKEWGGRHGWSGWLALGRRLGVVGGGDGCRGRREREEMGLGKENGDAGGDRVSRHWG